jgi:hypothetical protein
LAAFIISNVTCLCITSIFFQEPFSSYKNKKQCMKEKTDIFLSCVVSSTWENNFIKAEEQKQFNE